VLDPTTFALADRSLTNFTGEISEMLRGRFAGMSAGAGGGALGFAGAPSSAVADQAQAAFSGISSVATSYASDARPVLGKAPAAAPYYDTTIWASGFGGERKQRADGVVLPTTDTAFGGAMGVDRVLGGNLRLGAFVGAGASREQVELDVQKIDATYVFGGAYGRFDWIPQYLDFSLYGGGIDNKSTRQIANNTVASGIEPATASYGGWFISPEVTYGYRIPFNAITATPRVRVRYVGGQLDGYSESGSMQNLSVGRRSINDLEERGEVELSTISGAFKGSATVGIIGLERLGNPNINTVLLGQNLSFVTPGQASAFGGVFGMRMEYRVMPNASLFVAGEATAMSDKSDSFAATGGARVSF
jgi:outer membrane autotransporter protein